MSGRRRATCVRCGLPLRWPGRAENIGVVFTPSDERRFKDAWEKARAIHVAKEPLGPVAESPRPGLCLSCLSSHPSYAVIVRAIGMSSSSREASPNPQINLLHIVDELLSKTWMDEYSDEVLETSALVTISLSASIAMGDRAL